MGQFETYRCDKCGGTFETDRSDEDAQEEYESTFGDFDRNNVVCVCTDCYEEVLTERIRESDARFREIFERLGIQQTPRWWKLDADNNIEPVGKVFDYIVEAMLRGGREPLSDPARIVGQHRWFRCGISTVFLGLDHNFAPWPKEMPMSLYEPIVFETMVFGGQLDGWQWRYSTWAQAEAGHRRALRRVMWKWLLTRPRVWGRELRYWLRRLSGGLGVTNRE